jgi:4-amino-4-deoxy-L-arabinose transferase-like glycosyltransferase
VFVTFTPTANGTRNGTLTFNCTSIAPTGGGAFSCAQTSSSLLVALIGSGITVGVGVPTLSSFALALLASTLLLFSFLSLKRRRP